MKNRILCLLLALGIQLWLTSSVSAQGKPYAGPDDEAGDIAAEREGYMTGNRVFLYFRNTTELSDWPRPDVSKWPNSAEGVKMLDGVALMVGARVYIANDTIPVTDPLQAHTRHDLDTLFYLQKSYREGGDADPSGTIQWKLYPPFGYFNVNSEYPAMSNHPESWPPEGWPSTGFERKWPGEWNSRFGRGIKFAADLESFFVVNDAQDQEYLGPEDRVKYYPRPGHFIGQLRPDITIQKGKPWGGMGVRVETRGFQWNNPQSRDAIFWEYAVANISKYDLVDVAFGYWVDNQIGNEGDDEIAFFDVQQDMAYSWDIDGIGLGGLPTGNMGFAYLESPGLPFDGIDNDEDGLLDEKRDNVATGIVGAEDGIHDLNKFLTWYGLTRDQLRPHWDADEDQDWQDGIDLNGDGIYQLNEFAGDDVGLDGVGPGDINYVAPDEGECNHRPDYAEGKGCEPNFNAVDVSESDMVGLTAFRMLESSYGRGNFTWTNDKAMWTLLGERYLIEWTGIPQNLIETFSSGPFPLYEGLSERISMSILHAYDQLSGLNSAEHKAPALFEKKRIVQVIYEGDYRFASPPAMPTLHAMAGDRVVVLTWDDAADTRTREPLLKNINDFEGYKLYRASDKKFTDAEQIPDGFGNPLHKLPIFQCDLVDGRQGFTNFALINGVGYYLGDDRGILHYYVDREVQNGRTYYYALVAYDYGIPDVGPGIAPSENRIVIELDEAENVRDYGKNIQMVTPHQYAAGYTLPHLETNNSHSVFGSNTVTAEILAPSFVEAGHTYRVQFGVDTISAQKYLEFGLVYRNDALRVYDVSNQDTLLYTETPDNFKNDNFVYDYVTKAWYFNAGRPLTTDIFAGLRLNFEIPVLIAKLDVNKTGWITGQSPIRITQPTDEMQRYFPYDYDIVFTANDSVYLGKAQSASMRDENNERLDPKDLILHQKFPFYVVCKSQTDSTGANVLFDLAVQDVNRNGIFDWTTDRVLVGPLNTIGRRAGTWAGLAFVMDFQQTASISDLPKPGEVYRISFVRPWLVSDSFTFTVTSSDTLNLSQLKATMEQIRVVPNPYVATNAMEPAVSNPYLNQSRRLMFTHLPAKCTIKIFTTSCLLVAEIQVDNPADNGIAHWDLRSHEGLEIAAGIYIYHVKSTVTGDEEIGKFAVVK
ncbi:hypothetical protein L0128_07735 [candidate division KSB1 bacterium]|nr:hypothetical protein [candidate division KSB1 bacterium]